MYPEAEEPPLELTLAVPVCRSHDMPPWIWMRQVREADREKREQKKRVLATAAAAEDGGFDPTLGGNGATAPVPPAAVLAAKAAKKQKTASAAAAGPGAAAGAFTMPPGAAANVDNDDDNDGGGEEGGGKQKKARKPRAPKEYQPQVGTANYVSVHGALGSVYSVSYASVRDDAERGQCRPDTHNAHCERGEIAYHLHCLRSLHLVVFSPCLTRRSPPLAGLPRGAVHGECRLGSRCGVEVWNHREFALASDCGCAGIQFVLSCSSHTGRPHMPWPCVLMAINISHG